MVQVEQQAKALELNLEKEVVAVAVQCYWHQTLVLCFPRYRKATFMPSAVMARHKLVLVFVETLAKGAVEQFDLSPLY